MLVDINLLGERKKRTYTPILMIAIVMLGFVAGFFALYFYSKQLEFRHGQLEAELEATKQLTALQQEKLWKTGTSAASEKLADAVQWTKELPVPTVFFLQHLASLLPERGFLLQFSYSDDGVVTLQAQFDEKREAAYYLAHLNASDYIENATLQTIATRELAADQNATNIAPRYLANYSLILNKTALRNERGGE